MDLGGYLNIDKYKHILDIQEIHIPRLRGIRRMSEEKTCELTSNPSDSHQIETFNKYVGEIDVIMVHARLGGSNWEFYDCQELEKQPWFIEKVDDSFDSTYCDIYIRLQPLSAVEVTS